MASVDVRPRRWWIFLLAVIAILLLDRACGEEIRVVSFNIENYPKSPDQAAGAFKAISELDASLVAVQEITDVVHFSATARSYLGTAWRFVHPDESPHQFVGILYDSSRHRLLSTRTLVETLVYPKAKPAFEARFRPRHGGRIVRVITLHLKAGGEHHDIRRRQLDALEPVIAAARASRERVIVLGDFNSTGDPDRARLRALGSSTDMEWASEGLECTSYWDRQDGCVGSALDHVFTSEVPDEIEAAGPCKTEGCEARERCPVFFHRVSDHCPVLVEL